jgi:hypothetical protein
LLTVANARVRKSFEALKEDLPLSAEQIRKQLGSLEAAGYIQWLKTTRGIRFVATEKGKQRLSSQG